jgi:hypothetical protein
MAFGPALPWLPDKREKAEVRERERAKMRFLFFN